ncbi:hypothetical protein IGI04_025607 [Brassica rapa subsp. trilocularis]|uniref:Uncharacterized protein n=1 Tax=Brassica rapa subsp. trilocularis TaxID=1813537 RepID=A0ABQ7KWB6_BRACM|nr:hypothetical protein IGI04_025607 [Brassica rapa subsp. trilocularis]
MAGCLIGAVEWSSVWSFYRKLVGADKLGLRVLEREDDNEVSIDTQPAAAVVTPVSPEFQDIFLVEATNSPRRKIRRVSPDDYGVYIDEESNAHAMERKIINDSKEDIEAILELLNSLGGCYLSLPQYEGCFQMPRVHPTPSYRHNMLHTS